jgi:diguanylate cyclase (GGDEF)-like protein/PAS domain S-box-containing protein
MPGMRKPSPKKERLKVQADSTNPAVGSSLAEALLQSTGSGIYIVQDNKFVYINPYFTELSGYLLRELDGKNSLDLVYPDDRRSVKEQAITNLKKSRGMDSYEYRFVKKNGEIMWVMERITSVEYMGQRAALGSFMDINERKELEKALTQSEQRHRAILNQMSDACFEFDLSGKFTFTNSYMSRSLQYKQDELIGMDYHVIIPESDAGAVYTVFNRIYETGKAATAFSHRVKRKDGLEFFVESSVSLIRDQQGQPAGFICVGRDVSERKQLERALVHSEERFRNVLERMQDSYYEVDLGGRFTFVNEATCRDLLYTREELIGNSYTMIMSDEEAKRVFVEFHKVFLSGEPNRGFAHKVIKKGGATGYAESSVSLLKDDQGRPSGFNSVSRDVTERKLLEERLRRSEERFRTILENMQDSYYEVDLAGNFTFINISASDRLGYSRGELLGKNYRFTTATDDLGNILAAFNEVYKTGIPNKCFINKSICRDGSIVIVESSIGLLRNEFGEVVGFNSVGRDITQRMEFEQRLADMATHDFLTGLPNRVLLNDRLHVALAQAHRNKNKLAILTLDLDRFKTVNDTHGHHMGDELLKAVGQRLTGIIRSGDTIARMGGDEFLLLMPELHQSDSIPSIISKIVEAFKAPFIIEGHRLNISASIGIATYPDDGIDMDALMRKSDSAMYDIKKHGPSSPGQD